MSRSLNWEREGRLWPHREASEFISQGHATWHVQRFGQAGQPRILLLHGTGGSVHSWRGLAPILADDYELLAPDLPRHAFTTGHAPDDTSLVGMARAIRDLLGATGFAPDMIIGHSAGAALALQGALDHGFNGPIVGLNAALRPFPGPAAEIFPAIAKLLFVNPLVPRVFSKMASFGEEAERFIYRSTRSHIDQEGLACYAALIKNAAHTKGALSMMANWDLPTLRSRMGEITNPVLMVHSDMDAAIPLDWAQEAHGWLPTSRLEVLAGLGHLAHEEAPELAAQQILDFAQETLGEDL
ncbi:alpha/beta fold hydrolase [Erythrobacter sp. SCSIO 43205]|uniref:alpha/beta fold hydrolase BchO n=1 Tax=Erythrobacter sp. SCSIO 43205 TaxID=2779361 RepID=UPI001CA99EE5|nr:alpha/beta fold hydrolase BchO [Erythrobacter sp. SCSIO 43205]UAB77995.1 alpha/beta fold hydrolase [Erythrobacter sp. SCSIO 43205]